MKKTIDWSTYKFRSSQCYKLLTGSLPNKGDYNKEIEILTKEKNTLKNINGITVKWTDTKQDKLEKLIKKRDTPYFELLPKTMTSELQKIHRAETFNRNFSFTNKYVQKGIAQEEDAITVYQDYRNKVLGIKSFFINNKKRLENDYTTGEADLTDTNDFANCNEGFDIKCSWELDTFPFKVDELEIQYETQNQVYMWLSGAKKWTTAHCLVNTTEDLLHKEKMKWFYALNQPLDSEDKNYNEYVKKAKELEIRFIFDYDKFIKDNPGHQMEISRKEWHENNYDIPLKNRVVEHVSYYNQFKIDDLIERIKISREYLVYLDNLTK